MELVDVYSLLDRGYPLRHDRALFAEDAGSLVVNGTIALPVYPVQRSMVGGPDIPIIQAGGSTLATLVLSSRLLPTDPADFTDDQYVAYLTEATLPQVGTDYSFEYDYVIVSQPGRARYESEYKPISGLWGGFVHVPTPPHSPRTSASPTSQILAVSNLELPTNYHHENLFRTSQVTYAFERYLKLYHLLELMFDWKLVDKIRSLGPDLQGVGVLLSRYTNKEISRLRWLFEELVADPLPIAQALDLLTPAHLPLAKTIFYDFGKDGNPIDKLTEYHALRGHGGFQIGSMKAWRPKTTSETHRKLVLDVACYWIYRIRCCIAHSRIGEYVMSLPDEEFIIDFGEPLLRSVLLQVFQK